ncbi:hypothetical protein ACFX13_032839 [Malus domestica]
MKRDYLAATEMDKYINGYWVGIHECSAREKICTNSVAHIMNDETTQKCLQSTKRLMNLCQRRYPAMPSKAVEFDSLANGSDLQHQRRGQPASSGNEVSEERLLIMPAP